jgi:hypothetical protein
MQLRIDAMPLDFNQALRILITTASDDNKVFIMNMLRALWKSRNKEVLEGVKINPREICIQAEALEFKQSIPSTISKARKLAVYLVK